MKNIKFKDLAFIIAIALLLIPQTRQPIQVLLNKGLALFSPATTEKSEQVVLTNYNWSLQDANGNRFGFEVVKGKVVLVNFWATWCPPCIAEMSSLQELYNAYNDKIEFVFVSDEDQDVIERFKKKKGYSFKVYNPITEYPEAFDVNTIPRTFLIDKKGNIVIDKTGAANWNSEDVRQTIDALIAVETKGF